MSNPSSDPARGSAEPVIRLQSVQKSFALPSGEVFDAVQSLSLDIQQGDVFGLIGKSGAGKSTLLRLINLLERPDAGRVLVGGRDLTTLSRRELRDTRQNIGMIFQQFNLLQNATVFDNVAFPLKIHGRHSRAEIDARVRECLELVGLSEKIDTYPAQLSGGQKQRVAIARALAPRPQVLLCDEPTSALDSETTRSLLETLRDINQKIGVTIVIVTHELSVVEVLCRNVAILEKGRLVEQFEVDAAPSEARKTALGREIDELVRRRERDAREAREAGEAASASAPVATQRSALEVAYV
ncbi:MULTISPECIES: methionine ABC transporter ATP-binding protein [Variovorax]|jgi:D-methionine transport system ATP-binding protein|uniref:methionine ABC transporter ATP-binding protein n=1 Tax=Variovorax TaxID=34072 RepID=UPI0008DF7B86|nr:MULTISPECIES: ATP-binding cassette domain-containing protein [unclassified Variovorax]TAJ65993.1 MAG: ATP-binding cassette domain-containing protein [Variovorax sp.]SFO05566.1 D-methionine transport system ATP-binding protein [Variovorax sp. PDC80]